MHFIGILVFIVTGLFWLSRVARTSRDVANAANTVYEFQRKFRFPKVTGQKGLALITTPPEAACVLMVTVASFSDASERQNRKLTASAKNKIIDEMVVHMQITPLRADGYVTQMCWLVGSLTNMDMVLAPMTELLKPKLSTNESAELYDMLMDVARADGPPNREQKLFIARFNERLQAYA